MYDAPLELIKYMYIRIWSSHHKEPYILQWLHCSVILTDTF